MSRVYAVLAAVAGFAIAVFMAFSKGQNLGKAETENTALNREVKRANEKHSIVDSVKRASATERKRLRDKWTRK